MFWKKKGIEENKGGQKTTEPENDVLAAWRIYWREQAADTYLYGSEISRGEGRDVLFQNPLMPPGTIIKEWYSKTNYRTQYLEPALPMIDGESYYRLLVDMEVPEGETCLVRLVFYDRYEEEAGSMVFDEAVTDFRCPLKTYSYRMQLINAGCASVTFRSVTIQEVKAQV